MWAAQRTACLSTLCGGNALLMFLLIRYCWGVRHPDTGRCCCDRCWTQCGVIRLCTVLILTVVLVHTRNDVVDEEQNVFDDRLLVCGQSTSHFTKASLSLLLDASGNSLSRSHVLIDGIIMLQLKNAAMEIIVW